LIRTKTLVKSAIVQIDATPFRQWWESHYGQLLGKKRVATAHSEPAATEQEKSFSVKGKLLDRQKDAHVEAALDDQFSTGRLYAIIKSRPGQSGRCDGYILEGKELEFYVKKIKSKK
jgi:small subunit ribosomal protein S8e